MPALRCTGKIRSSISAWLAHSAPAITRPWPSKYLVAECSTTSAPKRMGFCSAGLQKQLSTTSSAPPSWAMSASAWMSHTSVKGLVGVSAISSLVLGRMALFHSVTSVCETKVVSMPKRAISLPSSLMMLPKTEREQMMWSPALSSAKQSRVSAPMPLAVASAAGASSIAARRCSILATVGLPKRL